MKKDTIPSIILLTFGVTPRQSTWDWVTPPTYTCNRPHPKTDTVLPQRSFHPTPSLSPTLDPSNAPSAATGVTGPVLRPRVRGRRTGIDNYWKSRYGVGQWWTLTGRTNLLLRLPETLPTAQRTTSKLTKEGLSSRPTHLGQHGDIGSRDEGQ